MKKLKFEIKVDRFVMTLNSAAAMQVTILNILTKRGLTDRTHSVSAVMCRITRNRQLNTDHTFQHEQFWQSNNSGSQQYLASVYIIHMLKLTDFLPYCSAFDGGRSDESWINRHSVESKASISVKS